MELSLLLLFAENVEVAKSSAVPIEYLVMVFSAIGAVIFYILMQQRRDQLKIANLQSNQLDVNGKLTEISNNVKGLSSRLDLFINNELETLKKIAEK